MSFVLLVPGAESPAASGAGWSYGEVIDRQGRLLGSDVDLYRAVL